MKYQVKNHTKGKEGRRWDLLY